MFSKIYLTLIFALPLIPSYLGIRVGGALINAPKVITLLCFFFLLVNVTSNPRLAKSISSFIKFCKPAVILYFCIFFWRLLSAFLGRDPGISVPSVIFEGIFYPTLFLTAFAVLRISSTEKIIHVITFSALIVSVLCAIELVDKENIFLSLQSANHGDDLYLARALTAKIRGGYRVQGTFYNPLSLAHYLIVVIPLMGYGYLHSKSSFKRLFYLITLIFSFAALINTQSRAALAIIFLLGAVIFVKKALHMLHMQSDTNRLAAVFMLFACVFALIGAIPLIQSIVLGSSDETASSTLGRLEQLALGWSSITEHPFIGIGPRLAALVAGVSVSAEQLSVDNFYLSLAVECGLPALFLFTNLLYISMNIEKDRPKAKNSFSLEFFLRISIVNFFAFLLISSLYDEVFPWLIVILGTLYYSAFAHTQRTKAKEAQWST